MMKSGMIGVEFVRFLIAAFLIFTHGCEGNTAVGGNSEGSNPPFPEGKVSTCNDRNRIKDQLIQNLKLMMYFALLIEPSIFQN